MPNAPSTSSNCSTVRPSLRRSPSATPRPNSAQRCRSANVSPSDAPGEGDAEVGLPLGVVDRQQVPLRGDQVVGPATAAPGTSGSGCGGVARRPCGPTRRPGTAGWCGAGAAGSRRGRRTARRSPTSSASRSASGRNAQRTSGSQYQAVTVFGVKVRCPAISVIASSTTGRGPRTGSSGRGPAASACSGRLDRCPVAAAVGRPLVAARWLAAAGRVGRRAARRGTVADAGPVARSAGRAAGRGVPARVQAAPAEVDAGPQPLGATLGERRSCGRAGGRAGCVAGQPRRDRRGCSARRLDRVDRRAAAGAGGGPPAARVDGALGGQGGAGDAAGGGGAPRSVAPAGAGAQAPGTRRRRDGAADTGVPEIGWSRPVGGGSARSAGVARRAAPSKSPRKGESMSAAGRRRSAGAVGGVRAAPARGLEDRHAPARRSGRAGPHARHRA